MFSREELKQNLIAVFEVALFMPNGVERFSPKKEAAIRSFIVPFLFMPLVVWVWILRSDVEPVYAVVIIQFARMLLTMVVFLGLVYLLSRQYERQEHFFRFVTAMNWTEIVGVILTVPVLFALATGVDMAVWENYAVFIQLFGYVYGAFIATHAFRMPWEMGGFVAIISLAVTENMLNLGLYVQSLVTVAA